MKPKLLPIASLVEDFSLYPRHRVEDVHVSDLVKALQAGETLPPIIAEAKTLRIVDGFHRRRALLKVLGDDAETLVDCRTYKTEADLFLEAVALNSMHGRKLDRHDQTRIVLKLRELHVPDQQIAISLHVPAPTIQQLAIRVVMNGAGTAHPSKRGLEHLRGQTLTDGQITVLDGVRSAEAGRLALELSRLLQAGLVDLTDDVIRERLVTLQAAIQDALKSVAA